MAVQCCCRTVLFGLKHMMKNQGYGRDRKMREEDVFLSILSF